MKSVIERRRERLAQKPDTTGAITAKLIGSINRTFSTQDGKMVLYWLMNHCGWNESSIGGNPDIGAEITHGTLINEARRSVYLRLRELIDHEILKEVEFHVPSQDQETKEE